MGKTGHEIEFEIYVCVCPLYNKIQQLKNIILYEWVLYLVDLTNFGYRMEKIVSITQVASMIWNYIKIEVKF
jgi:hypothetical protein